MNTYFLRSGRLGFRPWSRDDIGLAMHLWGDPRVTQFLGGPLTEGQVQTGLEKEILLQTSNGIQYWPTFCLADDAQVGCCGLHPYRPEELILEIGFLVRFESWGKGYASESARTVIDYAFRTAGASALFAGHHPLNERSRQLLGRVGFRYTHDEFFPRTGLNHPSYLMTREEFERRIGSEPAEPCP